jgi:hypothetical protein
MNQFINRSKALRAGPVFYVLHTVCNGIGEARLIVHEIAQLLTGSQNADMAGMYNGAVADLWLQCPGHHPHLVSDDGGGGGARAG